MLYPTELQAHLYQPSDVTQVPKEVKGKDEQWHGKFSWDHHIFERECL